MLLTDAVFQAARFWSKAADRENIQFMVLTDAGHFPHLQTPEDLARIALDFLGAG